MKKILFAAMLLIIVLSPRVEASVYLFDLSNIAPTVPLAENLTLLDADSTGTRIITGGVGRLYISEGDAGATWNETQPAGNVDKNWAIASMSSDGNIILAGVAGGRLYLSTDSGSTWNETQPAGNVDKNWGTVSVGDDGTTLLAGVAGGRLYLSTDSGSTWNETQPAGNVDKNWGTVSAPIAAGADNLMIAGVYGGRLYKTTDIGATWTEVQLAGNTDQNWNLSQIQYDGDRAVIGVYGGHLYATNGALTLWHQVDAGSAGTGWSKAVINSDDNTTPPLLAVNTTKNLFAGAVGVPDAPVVTLVSNGDATASVGGYPIHHTTELQRSSSALFGRPHGNLIINDKIYIGTITNPAKLVVFSNLGDLSVYDSVSVAGTGSFGTMVYDQINNRIYATALAGSGKLVLYSFNPDNIHDYQLVFSSPSIDSGSAPALATDGVYVYGATYYVSPTLFKIRISDWTMVTTRGWTGASYGHAAAIHVYNDRTEIYMTSIGASRFIKVNGNDLSYSEITGLTTTATDDMTFRYIDEAGGIAYVGSEVENKGYAIDTRTMTVTEFFIPRTYGMFSDGSNLYSLGIDGYITKFPGFDLHNPIVSKFFNEVPNELFVTSTGRTFMTVWLDSSYLKEYALTDDPQVMQVELSWGEEIPNVYYTIEISLDGVTYTTVNRPSSDIYTPSFVFSELLPETTYWVRITASNAGIVDSPSTVYSFTTPKRSTSNSITPYSNGGSSGITLIGRYINLQKMGKLKEAEQLLQQFKPVTPANTLILSKNLSLGTVSEDVRSLQRFLNQHGFIIAITGPGSSGNETTTFGPLTKKAVVAFQKSKNIFPLSGYVGPKTRSAIQNTR